MPSATDGNTVFRYALTLCYPNGRVFNHHEESEQPLTVGHEFDAFGRRWKLERELRPDRLTPEPLRSLQAFSCRPVPGQPDFAARARRMP